MTQLIQEKSGIRNKKVRQRENKKCEDKLQSNHIIITLNLNGTIAPIQWQILSN